LPAPNKDTCRRTATVWERLAGELAVISDTASQASKAAWRQDAAGLEVLIERLRSSASDTCWLHTASRDNLEMTLMS